MRWGWSQADEQSACWQECGHQHTQHYYYYQQPIHKQQCTGTPTCASSRVSTLAPPLLLVLLLLAVASSARAASRTSPWNSSLRATKSVSLLISTMAAALPLGSWGRGWDPGGEQVVCDVDQQGWYSHHEGTHVPCRLRAAAVTSRAGGSQVVCVPP